MSTVVDNGGSKHMQTLTVQDLEGTQTQKVVICLGKGRVVLQGCQISERCVIHKVHSEGEEDLVIYEDLLAGSLIGVQGCKVPTDNCNGALDGGIKEIIVDLGNSAVALDPLHQGLLGEILNDLEFLVPVTDSTRVQTVEGYQGRFVLDRGFPWLNLSVWDQPAKGALSCQRELGQEIGLCRQNRVEVLLEILAKAGG